jgi:hypothetical protein
MFVASEVAKGRLERVAKHLSALTKRGFNNLYK